MLPSNTQTVNGAMRLHSAECGNASSAGGVERHTRRNTKPANAAAIKHDPP